MKLITLILSLIGLILNSIYYVLISPITIYRWKKAKDWRKNAKVGDKCYFKNMLGTKTEVKIHRIEEGIALIKDSNYSQWKEINKLYPV